MDKEFFMKKALIEAKKSLKYNDVPVGAIIVKDGEIISKGYNKKEKNNQALAHCEIIALYNACKKLNRYKLDDCEIYITKEPCLMCMGAILSHRISKIYYGAEDKRFGTSMLASNNNFNYKCDIEGGILGSECSKLLTDFFENLRCEKNESSRKITDSDK